MLKQLIKLQTNTTVLSMALACLLTVPAAYAQGADTLSLGDAITQAALNDVWLTANEQRENSLRQEAIFTGQLPDPKMSIGLANLPVNTLDFNQEPMTQFKIGLNQSFPKGDTLALGQQQKLQQSEVNPYLRDDRRASVAMQVARLWLESFLAQETIALINADRALYEQLVDIADTNYRSASGRARQQDVVRAELELISLDDKLAMQNQKLAAQKQQLLEWLPSDLVLLPLSSTLPDLPFTDVGIANLNQASAMFAKHPRVRAIDKQIDAAMTGVDLARQSYKPGFSVGTSYGYRDNGPMRQSRDDFISLDVTFDLPLFTEQRQKPKVEAASYSASAIQTDRILLLRNLFSSYQQSVAELTALDARQALYEDRLLTQIHELTESTLAAYTADQGDFAEVMRAYITELNAKIDLLGIAVERQLILVRLTYLLTESTEDKETYR